MKSHAPFSIAPGFKSYSFTSSSHAPAFAFAHFSTSTGASWVGGTPLRPNTAASCGQRTLHEVTSSVTLKDFPLDLSLLIAEKIAKRATLRGSTLERRSNQLEKMNRAHDSIGDKLVLLLQALPPGYGTSDPCPCILRHSEKYIPRGRARFIAFAVGANPMMAKFTVLSVK
jgi:hypothetical protein